MGREVGATPNGRRAAEPISHGANPDPGFRADGAPTAMAKAIAAIQPGYGNTAPMQLELDPGLSKDEGGIEKVAALIKSHFRLGGTLFNINVIDAEKVLEAHRDPTKYPDLIVRVTGFTAGAVDDGASADAVVPRGPGALEEGHGRGEADDHGAVVVGVAEGAVAVRTHADGGNGRFADEPAGDHGAVTAEIEHGPAARRHRVPPYRPEFGGRERRGLLGDTLVFGARPERPRVAQPGLDLKHATDGARIDERLGLVCSRVPRHRPVDEHGRCGTLHGSEHSEGVREAHGHGFLDADARGCGRTGLHHVRVPGVLAGDDDDVERLRSEHLAVVVIRLRQAEVVDRVLQVPPACVRSLAEFRPEGDRVGAGDQLDLGMRGEQTQHVVDVHVAEADDSNAIGLGHGSPPLRRLLRGWHGHACTCLARVARPRRSRGRGHPVCNTAALRTCRATRPAVWLGTRLSSRAAGLRTRRASSAQAPRAAGRSLP